MNKLDLSFKSPESETLHIRPWTLNMKYRTILPVTCIWSYTNYIDFITFWKYLISTFFYHRCNKKRRKWLTSPSRRRPNAWGSRGKPTGSSEPRCPNICSRASEAWARPTGGRWATSTGDTWANEEWASWSHEVCWTLYGYVKVVCGAFKNIHIWSFVRVIC